MRAFRVALGGLTTRGRSFMAAGAAAAFCAVLLGQGDLLRVGLLLAALPLLCAAALLRSRFKVAGGRRLTPARVHAGQEARVFLRVDNVSRAPSGMLMLEDKVPYVLGPRPRFVLDRVEPRGYREVSYRVRSDLRGRYRLGPLQLRLADPFGLCELTRAFAASDLLTVVPPVHKLPPVRLSGEWTGYGESRTRAVAAAGEDDVIPRGYRHGDDIRRVHWRSTARYGELMVRREEQPLRSRCTLLLDTRAGAHRGTGPSASFEWAVSMAASLSAHLLERGYATRLLTDSGRYVPESDGSAEPGGETAGLLLDTLAVVENSSGSTLARAEDVVRSSGDGLLVAILGELDDDQVDRLVRLRRRVGAGVVMLLDTATWAGSAPDLDPRFDTVRRTLVAGGWTVLPVRSGDDPATVWRGADRHSAPAAYAAPAVPTPGTGPAADPLTPTTPGPSAPRQGRGELRE